MEVFYGGVWGTICDFSNWDLDDARVVCRELGFAGAAEALSYDRFTDGGDLLVLLTDVVCQGDELTLFNCTYNADRDHFCFFRDEGVRCGKSYNNRSTLKCEGEMFRPYIVVSWEVQGLVSFSFSVNGLKSG